MQIRVARMEEPTAMPAMAPGLKVCLVWGAEGAFGLGADPDEDGEWSIVMILGLEFSGNSACEMEKFCCSKSTNR